MAGPCMIQLSPILHERLLYLATLTLFQVVFWTGVDPPMLQTKRPTATSSRTLLQAFNTINFRAVACEHIVD